MVGRVEIRLGGEPVKAEAAGHAHYKVSVMMMRAVGEIECTVWWPWRATSTSVTN